MDEVCGVGNPQEVFAKLSSRSPKDATNRNQKKKEILVQILKDELKKKQTSHLSKNDIIACIFQAHMSALKLASAHEVLETLMASDRVMNDEIPLALEHSKTWSETIVLRKWCNIPIKFELRGFVMDNKLTALCQYYDEVYYPELFENKEKIEKIVLSFFESVKDKIPITPKEYVVDFIVDVPNNTAIIIEINPFGKPDGMGTGTVMFNLKNEEDRDLVFGRRKGGGGGEGGEKKKLELRLETKELSEEKFGKMIGEELDEIVKPFY